VGSEFVPAEAANLVFVGNQDLSGCQQQTRQQ